MLRVHNGCSGLSSEFLALGIPNERALHEASTRSMNASGFLAQGSE